MSVSQESGSRGQRHAACNRIATDITDDPAETWPAKTYWRDS